MDAREADTNKAKPDMTVLRMIVGVSRRSK